MLPGRWRRPILFCLVHLTFLFETLSACSNYTKDDVIVVAFLNVYDEPGCTRLKLRGLQQMAVLEKTATEISDEVESVSEGLKLRLQIVDTCNPTERNLDSALRNLKAQLICPNPPLLLGFIGPEINWKAIQRATSDFQRTQILPFKPETKEVVLPDSLQLYVGNDRLPLRSKIFLTTLNQLKWKSIFIVVGGSTDKKMILDHIFNKIDQVCVTGLVEIPKGSTTLNSFYSFVRKEYLETNSDGLVLFVDDPNDFRPLLQEMMEANNDESNPTVILYLCNVGLKSWELPRNHTMLILQETSDFGKKFNLDAFHNQTLWNQYYAENEIDFKRDAFGSLLDASLAPYDYALRLYWNAAKYAKKIKCDLGSFSRNTGTCFDMTNVAPLEWKSFVYKASYLHSDSLHKISLEMNLPVTVRLYFVNSVINFPQQVGRITENGIMDLKMNLQSVLPSKAIQSGLRKCIPPAYRRDQYFNPVPMDHESNWLATISKKLKTLLRFNGLVSTDTTEVIHTVFIWSIALLAFFLGLIFMTKCVYRVFRVRTEDERNESIRRRIGNRSVHI